MQGVLTRVRSYSGGLCFRGTRIFNPFLVRCLEPEILRQVLHCTGVFPIERVEYEDVGIIPRRMIWVTT